MGDFKPRNTPAPRVPPSDRVYICQVWVVDVLNAGIEYNGEPLENAAVCPECWQMQPQKYVDDGAEDCIECGVPKPFLYMDELARELPEHACIYALSRTPHPFWEVEPVEE